MWLWHDRCTSLEASKHIGWNYFIQAFKDLTLWSTLLKQFIKRCNSSGHLWVEREDEFLGSGSVSVEWLKNTKNTDEQLERNWGRDCENTERNEVNEKWTKANWHTQTEGKGKDGHVSKSTDRRSVIYGSSDESRKVKVVCHRSRKAHSTSYQSRKGHSTKRGTVNTRKS